MIYDLRFTSWLKPAPLALLLLPLTSYLSTCLAQGSLTPPGAPSPTMKSLDQIEPRTPISSAPYTITSPGSYYLTTNVTVASGDAITIAANNVILDLSGFTVSSTEPVAATGSGILLSGSPTNIAISNGHINSGVTVNAGVYSGSGFGNGIYCSVSPQNVRVKQVSVSGVLNDGIAADLSEGSSSLVESCTVNVAGGFGIAAERISDSSALNCGLGAIAASLAQGCYGSSVANYGIESITADHCYGISDSLDGVYTRTAQSCYGTSTDGNGIFARTAEDCYGSSSTGRGLLVTGSALNCYGTTDSGVGLDATACAVEDCNGYSYSGPAILAYSANNCVGISADSVGISAVGSAWNCTGRSSTSVGIYAYIAGGCYGSSDSGIGLILTRADSCYGQARTGTGLLLLTGGSLIGCMAQSSVTGISAGDGSTVQNCTVFLCSGDGIRVTNNCQVIGNLCTTNGNGSTSTASIHVLGINNRIDGNHCIGKLTQGGNGIKVEAGRNLIIRNSSKDHNTQDYDIIPGDVHGPNSYGQILAVPGNNFVNSNPWANFAF